MLLGNMAALVRYPVTVLCLVRGTPHIHTRLLGRCPDACSADNHVACMPRGPRSPPGKSDKNGRTTQTAIAILAVNLGGQRERVVLVHGGPR